MSARWQETSRIQRENGVYQCEVLGIDGKRDKGCTGRFEESHHGIWAGEKSKTAKEWRMFLDSPYNFCPSCHSCNIKRVGDPEEARDARFDRQVKRYGKVQMRIWLKSAPAQIKTRHEFERYWEAVQ
jgi:hypothetical protein